MEDEQWVFYATKSVDKGAEEMLTWGVVVLHHSASMYEFEPVLRKMCVFGDSFSDISKRRVRRR
jgi:hypothetical protein